MLVALLPLLERGVARLEQPADEKEQVVEVDGVVLAKERVVPLPDERRDPVELIARRGGHVGRALQVVLRAGDGGADGAGREEALAHALLLHRLAEERPLIALVVDHERAVDADKRPVAAQQAGAEGVEGPHGQVLELRLAKQALKPLLHLARRLVGEGDGQDRPRGDRPRGSGTRRGA